MDILKCQLCGFEFDRDDSGCSSCPLARGSHLACCPRCGYQIVGQSKTIDLISRACRAVKRRFSYSKEN